VRVVRFLRRDRSDRRSSDEAALGLEAFDTEQRENAKLQARPLGSVLTMRVLATLVVLESVPTILWIGGHFQRLMAAEGLPPVTPPVAAEGLPPVTTAVAYALPVTAIPCEPTAMTPPPPLSNGADAAPVTSRATAVNAVATPAAMVAGHLSVSAPVAMRVYERGRLVATTEIDSIMLSAGSHELEFVNDTVGYRVARAVRIHPNQTTALRLVPPMGRLNINAVPWAEVWIDNERVGETPLGNLPTRIGSRQITFRHPELGERRTTVLVTLASPARVGIDMRAK
jgi:hypothetical protein